MTSDYQASLTTCPRCVMDSSAREFRLDERGGCNFCESAGISSTRGSTGHQTNLEDLVRGIKASSRGKEYDCIVGVSGGLDSSYALHQCVELGLRPLAVHMDNGWNSSEASNNISNLVSSLDVDLFTYVTDWDTQKAVQKAFLDADVIDIELIYDNCMLAVCYEQARRHGVKYILGGSNTATEGVPIPMDWAAQDKWDATNIRAIAKAHGVRLGDFPLYSNLDWLVDRVVRKIQWVAILDYLPSYNKQVATDVLTSRYGYQPYSTKHFENVFTRLYQGFILPKKFSADKRKPHLSSLVISGQMTRDEALELLRSDSDYDQNQINLDISYMLTKMSLSQDYFEKYLGRPRREHSEWNTDWLRRYVWPILTKANKLIRAGRPV